MDLNLDWCIYETRHPTGFIYRGKSKTDKVLNQGYGGSGTRFNLILLFSPEFARNTWTTTLLGTYATEAEAYDAEEVLVPLESLKNPWVLNDTEGGRRGKYRNRNTLMKSINSVKRNANKKIKADKAKAKVAALKQKIKDLK